VEGFIKPFTLHTCVQPLQVEAVRREMHNAIPDYTLLAGLFGGSGMGSGMGRAGRVGRGT
jgi:hypothetical protein